MAKTWVLDTETKGTGAHIAPLERSARGAPSKLELVQLHPPTAHAPESTPATTRPHPKRFKVLDVLSGRTLAEDVPAREAVLALQPLRKAIDALVYVREEDGVRWRLLTLGETSALWALRDRGKS